MSMTLVVPSDVRAAEPPVGAAPSAAVAPASTMAAVQFVDPFAEVPPAPPAPDPVPRSQTEQGRREIAWTLFGVGSAVLTVTYLGTAFSGASVWDSARATQRENGMSPAVRRDLAYGASLMVPVAGPFVGIGFSGSAMRSLGLGLSGVLQAGGLVVAFIGTRNLLRQRRARRLAVSAGATPTSTHAALTLRF